jgi:hypothetical protein
VRLQTGIRYSLTFQQLDSCIAAGLDPHEWFYGMRYPRELKELICAWHDARGDIALHVEDARYRKSKK